MNSIVIYSKRIFLFIVFLLAVLFPICAIGENIDLKEGKYTIEVSLEGGTGKTTVNSPTEFTVKNNECYVKICWSSPNYDYMIVDNVKYMPVNDGGNSEFEIPVDKFDVPLNVIADTTAMSVPHEIQYNIVFYKDTIKSYNQNENIDLTDFIFIAVLVLSATTAVYFMIRKKIKIAVMCAIIFLVSLSIDLYCINNKNTQYEPAFSQNIIIPQTLGKNLKLSHSMALDYADKFAVNYYTDGENREYTLLSVAGEEKMILIGEKAEEIQGLADNIYAMNTPEKIYVAASQAMDMLDSAGGVDLVKYSALNKDDWYIESAKKKMEDGSIVYAGKYNAPDYELILSGGCDLAIENTMIYHTPQVKEKLQQLGIPVIVDCSSYEEEPLGRSEWVKFYGALTHKNEEAFNAFEKQKKECEDLIFKSSEKKPTVVFFYVSSNGEIKVRKSNDYISKMIERAGGEYIFSNLNDENSGGTVTIQAEQFYAAAKDADYIIYNSTVAGELENKNDLLEKNKLFANMKAVNEDHVYCTYQNLYQSTMKTGTIIRDINKMINGDSNMTYLYQL